MTAELNLLWAVITTSGQRLATPFDELVERRDDSLGRQRQVRLSDQAVALEVLDDIEQPVGATVFQAVVHEVR